MGSAEPISAIATFENVSLADQTCLHGEDCDKLRKNFEECLKLKGVPEDKLGLALGLCLYSCATIGTSNKVSVQPTSTFIKASFGGGKELFLTHGELNSFLDSQKLLEGKPNKLRCFCRTFQKDYISFAKEYRGRLPPIARANRHGLPAEDHYLAADFISTSTELTDLQQGRLLLARENATHTEFSSESPVTSLKQLGRGLATGR
uniref:Coat protein n=1 Tax=Beet yellows virus TaxID=12161 RepID=A0A8F2JFW4_9CLOS|nr:coat protein [Beet yellows virus]